MRWKSYDVRMRRAFPCLLAVACATARPQPAPLKVPVVDAHCDVTQDIVYSGYDFGQRHADHHEDLPRDQAGALDAQIFSIWVDPQQFPREKWFAEAEHQMLVLTERLPKSGVAIARTSKEIRENMSKNVMSALFGVEGGHELWPGTPEEQLAHLRRFAELGARYMTLTWSNSNDVGGSSGDEGRTVGLTDFGRQVIAEMERLGILVDLSHVSDPLFWDAIRAARKPVIASHSSARQIANVPRNLTDAQLEAIGKNGGAVCVNFFVGFLDDKAYAEIKALMDQIDPKHGKPALEVQAELKKRWKNDVPLTVAADHIQHVAKVAGIDHVCIGSDYDGIPFAPVGLDDASMLPNLTAELLRRGMPEADIRKVMSENLLRVLEETTPRP